MYVDSRLSAVGRAVAEETSAGDALSPDVRLIEVRVAELRQLFNAMDPAPFRDRDLDADAENFIVEWGRELPKDARLALLVHLDRSAGRADEAVLLRESLHQYFSNRAQATRRRLRMLFQRGRLSLLIGLAFLCAAVGASQLIEAWLHPGGIVGVLRESVLIGGWVAMWRPLEVFLYDWWPIRAEANLFDRLSAMPVQIRYPNDRASDVWQHDWPAAPATDAGSERRATARDRPSA